FHVPLAVAGLMTAVVAFAILALEQRGYRRFELAITALLAIVFCGFGYDLVAVGADPGGIAQGLIPSLPDGSLLIAAGIIGATVMPHVAASLFHHTGTGEVGSLEAAHAGIAQLVGGGAALAFAVALLASGLSSSSVGTYAGQVVMQGFIGRRVPLFARRAVTMLPALVVLGLGLPVTASLVLSQVVLSFGIPFALVPLLLLTRRRDIMGALVNRRLTTVTTGVIAALIIFMNVYLLKLTFLG